MQLRFLKVKTLLNNASIYRKSGWLWTDFPYFHKYLHYDIKLNSKFHITISKYYVKATHIIYRPTQLEPNVYSNILLVEPCPKSPRSSGWLWTRMQCIYKGPTLFKGIFASGVQIKLSSWVKFGLHTCPNNFLNLKSRVFQQDPASTRHWVKKMQKKVQE